MVYQKKGYKGKQAGDKRELTVKWMVVNKKIIKFEEEQETTYKLADNVLSFLDKIKPNLKVNVTIVDDTVTFIQAQENNYSPDESTQENQNTDTDITDSDTNSYTVKAISKTRDFYLFEESGEKEWFTVDPSVKNFLKDVTKGDVLEIKTETSSDGKRNAKTIIFAKVVDRKDNIVKDADEVCQASVLSPIAKKSSYRDEDSTDKRTALMTAKDIVIAFINKDKIDRDQLKEALSTLTKLCYESIQNL